MRYNKEDVSKFQTDSNSISSNFIKSVLKANKYLLKAQKKTFMKQRRELAQEGIIIAKSTYYALSYGSYRSINLCFLCYFANYWGKSLIELYEIGMKVINKELE